MSNVILVTGVMGSGKTLKVVADLIADLEENEKRCVEEKRTYYANITGLKIDGINPIPDDWRTTPDYSYIIIDEAQLIPMYARNRGKSHISVQELTLARKRGHKIIFITQAPNRLHQDILDVVQEHYHLARPYGAKLATCYMWRNEAQKNPMGREAQRKCENKFLFTYPRKCYDYYESAQVQNDGLKAKIPLKTLIFVSLPLVFFGFSAYMWFAPTTQNMVDGKSLSTSAPKIETNEHTKDMLKKEDEKILSASTVSNAPIPEQLEAVRVAFVMSTPDNCYAKNSRGFDLGLTYEECMKYANKEKPMNPSYIPKETKYLGNIPPIDLAQQNQKNNMVDL